MQMLRMWIFAWDHNVRQPYRVNDLECSCRAIEAGASERHIAQLTREFYTRRRSVRRRGVPESMRSVWLSRLETPPVHWRKDGERPGPAPTKYAMVDLSFAKQQGQ